MSPVNYASACSLICLQNQHDPIPLPDGETVIIGRSPLTKIIDVKCSRNQVALTADWTKREVKVKQLGQNNSAVDGKEIGQNSETTVNGQSTLFILSGCFPHKVAFKRARSANKESSETSPARAAIQSKDAKEDKRIDHGKQQIKSSDKGKESNGTKSKLDKSSSRKRHSDGVVADESSSNKRTKLDREVDKTDSDLKKSKSGDDLNEVNLKLKAMKEAAVKEQKSSSSKTSEHSKHSKSSSSHSSSKRSSSNEHQPSSSVKSPSESSSSSTPTEKAVWTSHEHLHIYTSTGVVPRRKIASFDLDGTLILTKSGKTFPTDSDDWRISYPEVFGKMKQFHSDHYKIVIFTNQLGIAKGKTKIDDLKTKIENIVRKLQVPCQVFVATHEGRNRKPMDGMWQRLKREYNGGKEIEVKRSIYVGDAAGRLKDWAPKKKKDFSNSDRLFALNIGVSFQTPEECFLKAKPTSQFSMPVFDPRQLKSDVLSVPYGTLSSSGQKEIILLVGFPACGKSHFANTVLQPLGYKIVNRDTLKTWQKCVAKTNEYLAISSVVVDNTNLTKDERERYVDCARKAKVPCRCFVFTTTVEHCRHNEKFRQMSDTSHAKINEMIFNQTKSRYQEPSMQEGFSELVNVNFVPIFSSASQEKDYRKFLLEK